MKDFQEQLLAAMAAKSAVEAASSRVPLAEAPSDWESPDWQSLSVVHEWKRYVSDRVRELWHSFTDEQKIALAQQADEIASKEEWD